MVLHQNTVYVHSTCADSDAQRRCLGIVDEGRNLECRRSSRRHSSCSKDVQSRGVDASGEFGLPFVPVRIQLDPALLHDDPEVILPWVKDETAPIETHRVLYSILINNPELKSDRNIFLQPDAKVVL